MKVIIAGSRSIESLSAVNEAMALADLFGIVPTEVFSGKAPGVDTLGEQWAADHGIPVRPFPARWRVHGVYNPRAGHLRNTDMANHADALVAIWDGQSDGTRDMITKAERRKLLVYVYQVPSVAPTTGVTEAG